MQKEEKEKVIHEAGKNQRVLRIQYRDKLNRVGFRNVEPYEIKNDHLFAYCRKRKSVRQFNLDRIEAIKPTPYMYFAKWPIKLGELQKEAIYNPWLYKIASMTFGDYYSAQVE